MGEKIIYVDTLPWKGSIAVLLQCGLHTVTSAQRVQHGEGGHSNFIVENYDGHYFSQMIKVNVNNQILLNFWYGTLLLWSSSLKPIAPVLPREMYQTDSNMEVVYYPHDQDNSKLSRSSKLWKNLRNCHGQRSHYISKNCL